jgi:hypothetical protein
MTGQPSLWNLNIEATGQVQSAFRFHGLKRYIVALQSFIPEGGVIEKLTLFGIAVTVI